MNSQNDYYYICKKGHITVGSSKTQTKCQQPKKEIKLVKKGRSGVEKETIKETICEENIVSINEIPKTLDYFNVWEPDSIKAFLMGQSPYSLREGFIIDIQHIMSGIKSELISIRKEIDGLRSKKIKT